MVLIRGVVASFNLVASCCGVSHMYKVGVVQALSEMALTWPVNQYTLALLSGLQTTCNISAMLIKSGTEIYFSEILIHFKL